MSSCPKCGTAIDGEAFGLVACAKCKAMLNVDLDGNATVVVHEPLATEPEPVAVPAVTAPAPQAPVVAPAPPTPAYQSPPAESIPESPPMLSFHPPEPQSIETESPSLPPLPPPDFQFQPPPAFENPPATEIPAEIVTESNPAPTRIFQSSLMLAGFMEPDPTPQKPLSVFKEISEFASALTAPSLFSYSFFIEGLENQGSEVIAALLEKKFGWTKSQLEEKINGDRMVLKKINPAQAVMLVKLLQNIPVRISWRQDDF